MSLFLKRYFVILHGSMLSHTRGEVRHFRTVRRRIHFSLI